MKLAGELVIHKGGKMYIREAIPCMLMWRTWITNEYVMDEDLIKELDADYKVMKG